MLVMTGAVLMVCAAAAAPVAPAADTSLARLWHSGQTWTRFSAALDARVALWRRNIAAAAVPDALLARARRSGRWRLLIVSDPGCSDSANSLPYVARLAGLAPNLEIRIVRSTAGAAVKDAHPAPHGRGATPTILVLDRDFNERGCWIERPASLQHWFMNRGDSLLAHDIETFRTEKQDWYDSDRGLSTLRELVEVLEAAAAGTPRCGFEPAP